MSLSCVPGAMRILLSGAVLFLSAVPSAAADGEESCRTRCALCHGGDAAGSDRAGSILATLDATGPEELARIITEGVPSRGGRSGATRSRVPKASSAYPGIGLNRGVAVHGDLVFSVTDHAHVIALDRFTGERVWDTEMDDYREHYGAVVAPLVVGDLVVAGISAGDTGLRGFLDAYHAETGERAWRFWTIPAPGEPGSETWGDPEVLRRGCGATWLTGSFDAELDLLYWATGNPCPDMNGDRRPGDNLWTNSVVALRPRTGEMVWYFQFTPHDTHDWDAQGRCC